MGTLLYAPAVRVIVETAERGIIDLTDDLVQGTVTLTENSPSGFSFSLANHRRKYDGVFTPNDRIVVQMRRIGPYLQTFSGYLDRVPKFSIYPRTINLAATCSLKRLKYHPWDPGTYASFLLIHNIAMTGANTQGVDAGIKGAITTLLTEVGQWPKDQIHISGLPANWFATVSNLFNKVHDRTAVNAAFLGNTPTIAGVPVGSAGPTTIEADGPGTGLLPATSGKASYYAGLGTNDAPNDMALSGESGRAPRDPWYVAMRFQYVAVAPNGQPQAYLTSSQQNHAMKWWTDRKILVTNPKNGKSVVLRCADWGPNGQLNRVIDMSKTALVDVLGASTDSEVSIAFAPLDAPLGPYTQTVPAGANGQPAGTGGVNYTIPPGTQRPNFAWGGYSNGEIPVNSLTPIDSQGLALLHPSAAAAFTAMAAAAAKDGVTIAPNGGNAYRSLAQQAAVNSGGHPKASPGSSNHGWGFAVDINVGDPPGRPFQWLNEHAQEFGWQQPPFALSGQSTSEPWHWEWYAAVNILGTNNEKGNPQGLNYQAPARLLNAYDWEGAPSDESDLLYGARALMNDQPLLTYITRLTNTSMRSYMSAPNGDFIAWFPDYFGLYDTAGKMVIEDIEIKDFTMAWSDDRLITHQFVAGSPTGLSLGDLPGGAVDILQMTQTSGIATVEYPEILQALFGIEPGAGFGDAQAIFRRFGARPDFTAMGTITGPTAEFWFALWLLQRNWADQFSADAPFTFMPELYPGMLVQLPSHGFQAYVTQVTHHFDFSDSGGGFSTNAVIIAPSNIKGGGLYQPPKTL